MGVSAEYLRVNGRAGSVDLSLLAQPIESWNRPVKYSFLTRTGLWYALSPLIETDEHPQTSIMPDNTIYPVNLEFENYARINGSPLEEAMLGLWFISKWVRERRHFPAGMVAVQNSVITEGDRLVINGRQTGPVDVSWSTELVHPDSEIRPHMNYIGNTPDGEFVSVGVRTMANF
jgi:hypothetical protein